MSDQTRKAICCICGAIRTCRRARNHREENYWFKRPVDLDWHRETGDLKCSECGRVTTHALLHPAGDWAADHAEMMQRIATGSKYSHFTNAELRAVAEKYRQGLPRNPELNHFWWITQAQAAWDRGDRTVQGLCGEPMRITRDPSGRACSSPAGENHDQQVEPRPVRDQEYEDPETGLWWQEIDCVDCLRVWHLELLRRRRNVLAGKLTELIAELLDDKVGYPKKFDLRTVDTLISVLDRLRENRTAATRSTTS